MKTMQNETGRSMVEMLGVLAIIGVLSIGGIQGYTFAMNKYRANNVLNEINMASHQLATELVTSRNAQKMLSLGNPYDNGTMTTENYPFDYGCGNYDSAERACQQAEQGYWVSVGGLTEKVCQTMLAENGFLPYIAETKLNGETVTDGINCTEEDNEITFLFNADGSGKLAENVGGGNGDEDDEPTTPTVTCPANTSEEGQGGLATTLTDTATGKVLNCYCIEIDTKYTDSGTCETLPETCNKNADCNRGEYCNITDYGSDYCTKDTSNMKGSCRNASSDIAIPASGTNPPFVGSNPTLNWWSAKYFCEALGKTLVELSDYECAHTFCPSGCDAVDGYCRSTKSHSVSYTPTINRSAIVEAMFNAYHGHYSWTNTDYNSCKAYIVGLAVSSAGPFNIEINRNRAFCK